jgi:DNA-binding PadR family transcriptional regulator
VSTRDDPRSFLPLTPLVFQVLLALAGGSLHGYGLIGEVRERTDGVIRLRTGTLYVLLQRLLDQGWIARASSRGRSDDDPRRRYYELTASGRAVLQAEARRLEGLVGEARRKHVLGHTAKG